MKDSERLKRLKDLRLKRRESGSYFKTANECMEWIDNVAPLLKYDENHYNDFISHAQIVRITHLSRYTLMPHLESMVGIVNQAVFELENQIQAPIVQKIKKVWHESFWGKILIGVLVGLIVLCASLVAKYISPTSESQAKKELSKMPTEPEREPSKSPDQKSN